MISNSFKEQDISKKANRDRYLQIFLKQAGFDNSGRLEYSIEYVEENPWNPRLKMISVSEYDLECMEVPPYIKYCMIFRDENLIYNTATSGPVYYCYFVGKNYMLAVGGENDECSILDFETGEKRNIPSKISLIFFDVFSDHKLLKNILNEFLDPIENIAFKIRKEKKLLYYYGSQRRILRAIFDKVSDLFKEGISIFIEHTSFCERKFLEPL